MCIYDGSTSQSHRLHCAPVAHRRSRWIVRQNRLHLHKCLATATRRTGFRLASSHGMHAGSPASASHCSSGTPRSHVPQINLVAYTTHTAVAQPDRRRHAVWTNRLEQSWKRVNARSARQRGHPCQHPIRQLPRACRLCCHLGGARAALAPSPRAADGASRPVCHETPQVSTARPAAVAMRRWPRAADAPHALDQSIPRRERRALRSAAAQCVAPASHRPIDQRQVLWAPWQQQQRRRWAPARRP